MESMKNQIANVKLESMKNQIANVKLEAITNREKVKEVVKNTFRLLADNVDNMSDDKLLDVVCCLQSGLHAYDDWTESVADSYLMLIRKILSEEAANKVCDSIRDIDITDEVFDIAEEKLVRAGMSKEDAEEYVDDHVECYLNAIPELLDREWHKK